MAVDVPHFKFPFQLTSDGSRVQVTKQDSDEEIMDCIEVLLATEVGERVEMTDYGILDQVFRENGVDVAHIMSQIRIFEERANVQLEPSQIEHLIQNVTVAYRGGPIG